MAVKSPTNRSVSLVSSRPGSQQGAKPTDGERQASKVIRRSSSLAKAGSTVLFASPRAASGTSTRLPRRRSTVDVSSLRRSGSKSSTQVAAVEEERARSQTPPPPSERLSKTPVSTSTMDMRAMILAKQHRLEPREVKRIFKAFQLVDPGEGGMDIQDFHAMMCNVFDVPSIHTETLHTAHTACGFDDSAIIERFVEWYVQNMFTEVNALKACPKQTTDTNLTYTLARKHGCSIQAVDKIRKEFVRFDADGSGEIDYQEFCNMMGVLMKVASLGDISEQRLKKFWQETSKSGKGLVDLAGFCEWYLKYFNPDDQERQSMLMCGPAEALYASYHPIVLRRNSLQGHLRSL